MLTRAGVGAVAAGVALVVAGRVLGVLELYLLGATAVVLAIAAVVRLRLVRLDLGVSREADPPRVHAGTPAAVRIELSNRGRRPTPVLRLVDPVTGTRGADVGVGPLEAGGRARATYRLPTERRGVLDIGPLELVLVDPFGLARLALPGAPRTQLIVYPRIEPLAALGETSGYDPESAIELPSSLGRSGEEFYALRPYVVGDELRRVHWPSSARYDELMVRQHELPWQGRATVVLDVRSDHHSPESLDLAVSAAASVLAAARGAGDLVRLVTTAGVDSGWVLGNSAFTAVLDHLAVVQPSPHASLPRALERLGRTADGGALVAVGGEWTSVDRGRVRALGARFRSVTTVRIDRSAWDATAAPAAPEADEPADGSEIVIAAGRPLAAGWRRRVTLARRRPHRIGPLR